MMPSEDVDLVGLNNQILPLFSTQPFISTTNKSPFGSVAMPRVNLKPSATKPTQKPFGVFTTIFGKPAQVPLVTYPS